MDCLALVALVTGPGNKMWFCPFSQSFWRDSAWRIWVYRFLIFQVFLRSLCWAQEKIGIFKLFVSSVGVAFKQEQYQVSYLKWLSPGVGLLSLVIQQLDDFIKAPPLWQLHPQPHPQGLPLFPTLVQRNSLSSPALSREQGNPSEEPSSRLRPSHWPELGRWWITLMDFHSRINPT